MTGIPADRRLVTLFQSATDAELDYGLTWYADAHEQLRSIAAEHGVSVDTAAAVTAALSPQTNWPDNLNKTRQLLATGDTYGFRLGRGRAQRVVAGEAPLDVLGGPKVRAFYSNLADPVGSDAVTVDRHAVDAALGFVGDDNSRKRILERKGGYEGIADAYRSAARVLGVKPHVVQAVVWAVWRNRFGRYHYQRLGNESQNESVEALGRQEATT